MQPKALHRTAAIVIAVTFALDQATKTAVRLKLPLCTSSGCRPTGIAGTIGFLRVENAGSAFGFLQGVWWWTLLSILGIAAMPLLARRSRDPKLTIGTALLVGGGLANLADRLLLGGVVDFIDLGIPVIFNLADVALALGCVLVARSLWRSLDAPVPGTGHELAERSGTADVHPGRPHAGERLVAVSSNLPVRSHLGGVFTRTPSAK